MTVSREWEVIGKNTRGEPVRRRRYVVQTDLEVVQGDPAQVGDGASEDVSATAAAEAKATELRVDIATVQGTGLHGRVTVSDVEAAAAD